MSTTKAIGLGAAAVVAAVLAILLWRGNVTNEPVTAAKIFDQMVKDLDKRRSKNPWDRKQFAQDPYEMLDVKIEDWLATPEARFAHSIKIPNPVPADSGYRPGMSQQDYFGLLCKNEAGEFIFKTVDNVDGLYQIRPRRVYGQGELQHLYALEDPYGYWPGDWERVGFNLVSPTLYAFFEISPQGRRKYGPGWRKLLDASLLADPPEGAVVARYFGNTGQHSKSLKVQFDTKPKARYGFTWRGVKRPHDREMGIAGGELIVLDLQTNEILGVRRGYAIWNRGWTARVCPRYGYHGGEDKGAGFTSWFVAKVARPHNWEEYFAGLEQYRKPPQ